ncbi:MAG: hypothetical protein IPL08_16285 [Saprospiraceae bacterium]|nr:hypothetical protein [Saprospiraceae bacterium]
MVWAFTIVLLLIVKIRHISCGVVTVGHISTTRNYRSSGINTGGIQLLTRDRI